MKAAMAAICMMSVCSKNTVKHVTGGKRPNQILTSSLEPYTSHTPHATRHKPQPRLDYRGEISCSYLHEYLYSICIKYRVQVQNPPHGRLKVHKGTYGTQITQTNPYPYLLWKRTPYHNPLRPPFPMIPISRQHERASPWSDGFSPLLFSSIIAWYAISKMESRWNLLLVDPRGMVRTIPNPPAASFTCLSDPDQVAKSVHLER